MSGRKLSVTLDAIVFGLQAYGGISNYWDRLIAYMDAAPNVDSHVVLPRRIQYAGYNPQSHPHSSTRTELIPPSVSRYLYVRSDGPCDVFHSSYFRLPMTRSCRYVVTVYDFIYERFGHGLARWVHSHQKRQSIRHADAVICISRATRTDVLHYVPDVEPSRVHVVHLGVDHKAFFPEHHGESSELENVVLYVGQRRAHKRFDLAVEAIAQCGDLSLGIVGPPLSPEEVEWLESRLRGRWRFFGSVPSSRLRQLYSAAFAFIFPSDYEGFGLPILESMACGCPVVAAHTASLPEVGGTAALYAVEQRPESFAAALSELQASTIDRQNRMAAGLRHVSGFSWTRTLDATLAIFQGDIAICPLR
jgi:mannosyltransferase